MKGVFLIASASEELWAEHGLTGLVLVALIGIILIFIKVNTKKDQSFLKASALKDDRTQRFISDLLGEEREERKEEREERKAARQENAECMGKLSDAIDRLSQRIP